MVNSSRYLGSDDGLKLQQQALAQTAQAATQATNSANEGVQAYLQGAVRNSQRLVELEQTRYAVEAQAASRPNQFSELVKAGVSIASDIRQQQKKEEQLKLQQKQAIASSQKYAQLDTELSNLVARYDQENWNKGIESYNTESSVLLGKYAPTNTEEAKEWAQYVSKASEARQRRSRQVQERLQQAADDSLKSRANIERENLRTRYSSQLAAIEKGTFADQAQPRIDWINNDLQTWLKNDNGLPEEKKLQIAAEILNTVTTAYAGKQERWQANVSGLSNLQTGINAKLKLIQDFNLGKLDYNKLVAETALLEQQYPELSKFSLAPGDADKHRLSLLQLDNQYRELQKTGDAAAAQELALDPATVDSFAAIAVLNPQWADQYLRFGSLKDNPGIQAALRQADLIQKFKQDSNRTTLDIQRTNVDIVRQNLSSVEAAVDFQKLMARQQQDGKQLTVAQQQILDYINNISVSNPLVAALLSEKLNPNSSQPRLNPEEYQRAVTQWQTAIGEVVKQQQTYAQQLQNTLLEEYSSLYNSGLIDPRTGKLNEAELNKRQQNAFENYNKLNERYNQRRLEITPQIRPPIGVQSNFSESSAYAPLVDDKGRLVLVPRAKAQIIEVNGQQIVTPVIAGDRAPMSGNGHFGAPRAYRNGTHYGQDFALSPGDKSIALVSGTVVHVGSANGYGNFVDILGDNGVVYRYGHQRAFVKAGQRVNPGQPISTSDGSGVGSPHLHFEVRPNPQFTNGRYDISKNFGMSGAIDPIAHLQKLNAGDSNVLTPRGNQQAFRSNPEFKVPGNSTLLSNAGALNAGNYQRAGSVPGKSVQRFSGQRPARTGSVKASVKVGSHTYDFGDDMGYAELRNNPELMRAFHQTAQSLGVPAEWIVDIARQESGSLNPYKDHNGNHYGLFGFGNDSFHDKSIHRRLRAGKVNGVEQLKLYERYLRENGWDNVVKQKKGNITIADLWAFTRMGWNDRKRFWSTGDKSIQASPSIPKTYEQELKLLGKWVGRQYDFNDRLERNKAVSSNYDPHCQLCVSMQKNGSFAPHVHRK